MIEPVEIVAILFATSAGGVLAYLHLLTVSWAVRQLAIDGRGEAWLLATGVARIIFVVGGFWLIAHEDPVSLIAALVGFVVVRQLLVSRASAGPGEASAGSEEP